MNQSDINDGEISIPTGRKWSRIMSSWPESSDSNLDYDTDLGDTEIEDSEKVEEIASSNSIVYEKWLLQNAERPPFPFATHPG